MAVLDISRATVFRDYAKIRKNVEFLMIKKRVNGNYQSHIKMRLMRFT